MFGGTSSTTVTLFSLSLSLRVGFLVFFFFFFFLSESGAEEEEVTV